MKNLVTRFRVAMAGLVNGTSDLSSPQGMKFLLATSMAIHFLWGFSPVTARFIQTRHDVSLLQMLFTGYLTAAVLTLCCCFTVAELRGSLHSIVFRTRRILFVKAANSFLGRHLKLNYATVPTRDVFGDADKQGFGAGDEGSQLPAALGKPGGGDVDVCERELLVECRGTFFGSCLPHTSDKVSQCGIPPGQESFEAQ